MAAPKIDHLDGGFTYRSPGGTFLIDQEIGAVVTDDDNDLATLEVLFWWDEPHGSIGIDTQIGGVSLSDGTRPGSIVSIDTIAIGQIDTGSNSGHLIFKFNENATPARVQELIRALTYTNLSSEGGFGDMDMIGFFLWDKTGAEESGWVTIADKVSGSGEGDTFSVEHDDIGLGDELDGGAGNDVFDLMGGGEFNLHWMGKIIDVETIRGSSGNDFITIKGSHLNDVQRIESGGGTEDRLTIRETVIDLSGIVVHGFKAIELADHGATITVDNAATAKLVTGYKTVGDTLILTSGSLTGLERQILHQQGIDTIITKDESGRDVSTTHRPPQISAFNGATINAPIGTTAFLDAGRDAILRVDSIIMKSLSIHIDGPLDPTERIEVDARNGVTLSQGGISLKVSVDGHEIGRAYGVGTSSVSFIFDDQATDVRVQKLIRSLTYTKTDGTTSNLRKVVFSFEDIGGRETSAEVSVDLSPIQPSPNAAPSNIALSSMGIQEASPDNTWIGDLSATDASGSTCTYSLVDDAGGRFKIDGHQLKVNKGTLLDYEQAKSHAVRIKVTDQGGLSLEKSFTISVGDVGRETITGTASDDIFVGGAGSDRLGGGDGSDRLTGGKGRDTFVFKNTLSKTQNVDTITDFRPKDDTIQLENKIFKKLKKAGTLSKNFFAVGSKAKDKDDYIVYDKAEGYLYYDADGSGKGKAILFAKLKASIDHKDFFVI